MKRALKSLGAAVQKRDVVIINRTLDLPVLSLFITSHLPITTVSPKQPIVRNGHVSARWGQRGLRLCMKLIEREISRNSRIGRRETNAVD